MTKCLQVVIMNKARINRLKVSGNTCCSKCGKEMVVDEEMIKKKRRGGKHNYFHPECYERQFI